MITALSLVALDYLGLEQPLSALPRLLWEKPIAIVPAHTRLFSWNRASNLAVTTVLAGLMPSVRRRHENGE